MNFFTYRDNKKKRYSVLPKYIYLNKLTSVIQKIQVIFIQNCLDML